MSEQKLGRRPAKVTDEHKAEAKRLKEIWQSAPRQTQDEFGERFDVGNQSAVGQFLNGRVPLSLKAAVGFARGLGVSVADFSPRLAAEIERLHQALGEGVGVAGRVDAPTDAGRQHSAAEAALSDWRLKASARSREVIDTLILLAQRNQLSDDDWSLIEQLAARFRTA